MFGGFKAKAPTEYRETTKRMEKKKRDNEILINNVTALNNYKNL
ncbi:hypothetical protein [Peribacillus glennii]|nr:hypothetical protein [Peribacillus glennii]